MTLINQILPEHSMQFDDGKGVVAKLSWGTGVMVADGNLEHGAEIFFNFVKNHVDSYIREELKRQTLELEDRLYMAEMQNDIYKSTVDGL
jgi:hypothetical protein